VRISAQRGRTAPVRAWGATIRDQSDGEHRPRTGDPVDPGASLVSPSAGQSAYPGRPPVSAEVQGVHPSVAIRRRLPWWKRFRRSIVLVFLAALFSLATVWLYRNSGELPTPPYATLGVVSIRPIALIEYTAIQVTSSTAEIKITVELPVGAAVPPPGAPVANLVVGAPTRTSFRSCPVPACETNPELDISSWRVPLAFKAVSGPNGVVGTASADFYVYAHSFGDMYNDASASVSIPEVIYKGSGTPYLVVQYRIPDAVDYDWPVLPPVFANTIFASWDEPITGGQVRAEAASGTDYSNQSRDTFDTFLAGITLGVAGGAVVSAIQEALPDSDKGSDKE
jgi:hypothetical protein